MKFVNTHALIVGIAHYDQVSSLPDSVLADAQAIYDVLTDEALCAYPRENVTLLTDGAATQSGLRQALADLAARSSPDATVFLYTSSHGAQIESGEHAGEYLLPADADITNDDSLAESAIAGDEYTRALAAIPARKLVVVFDCCHAGGIGQPKDGGVASAKAGLSESLYERLTDGSGRVILASSRSSEKSWILPGATNSLFTTHLVAGLRGAANGAGGVIRIFDLFDYVQTRVVAEHPEQHPIFKAEIEENFPIALYLGGEKAPAPEPTSLDDDYTYDVFISHSGSKEDRTWVREQLLPLLDGKDLRVAVDFRAPLGVPKLSFIEDAVQHSRYVAPILTEAYIGSGLAEFESLVAQYFGLEEGAHRLLPLMAEQCTPRLGLRMLPILDLTDSDEVAINIDRLIDQLQRPPGRRLG